MKPKLAIVALFALAVGIILFFTLRGGDKKKESPNDPVATGSGPVAGTGAAPAGRAVTIELLYSTEKKEWLESAVAGFQKDNPAITVKLTGKGSLEAAQAIVDGTAKPTLWSPADSLVLGIADADWNTKYGVPLVAADGDAAPQPLVLSPLVFVVWKDRAEVLLAASEGALSWKAIHKAVTSPRGWPAVGGKPDWGFVKLGHTDPTKSNSGLQALLLMTYEFYGKTSGLVVGDLLDPKYQQFVKEVEKGVSKFEASTGTFMTDMIRFGPSKYDIAVVYESLAIAELEHAQGRWGDLNVYYPATTVWSDHPLALLAGDWTTPDQTDAANKLVAYLHRKDVQGTALRFGFRPADPAVPIKSLGDGNPFTRLADHGVRVDVPPVAQTPDGAVIRNLMTMWSRIVSTK
jgi:hypothetical protein